MLQPPQRESPACCCPLAFRQRKCCWRERLCSLSVYHRDSMYTCCIVTTVSILTRCIVTSYFSANMASNKSLFHVVVPPQRWNGWKWERSCLNAKHLTAMESCWPYPMWKRGMVGNTCVQPKTLLERLCTTLMWWWKVGQRQVLVRQVFVGAFVFVSKRKLLTQGRQLFFTDQHNFSYVSQSRQNGWQGLLQASWLWLGLMFTSSARSVETRRQT